MKKVKICQNVELFVTKLEAKQTMSMGWKYELCIFEMIVWTEKGNRTYIACNKCAVNKSNFPIWPIYRA